MITLGKGWSIHGEKPGACTGEYLSICGCDSSDSCPFLGYHDSYGAIVGLDACGLLVLDIPQVETVFLFSNMPLTRAIMTRPSNSSTSNPI
jgi:hypothetical protein